MRKPSNTSWSTPPPLASFFSPASGCEPGRLVSGSFSMMKPVIPVWAGSAAGSVFARSMTIPARQPFVTHLLAADTYSSPSRTAVVGSPARPTACGSVMRTPPDLVRGKLSERRFCSSVPCSLIIVAAMKEPLTMPER